MRVRPIVTTPSGLLPAREPWPSRPQLQYPDCVQFCSAQVSARSPYGQDYYVLGNAPLNYANAANGVAFSGTLNGQLYAQQILDYGSIYASKTFQLLDGRRIWYSYTPRVCSASELLSIAVWVAV